MVAKRGGDAYNDRMYPSVRKKTDQYGGVYYTIYWSPLEVTDKYTIIKSVPAMAGIFELYYMDDKKKLNLFFFSKVWIGGLRSRLRRYTDPELEIDEKRRQVLDRYECYFRYSLCDSDDDMQDIIFFFASTYMPRTHKQYSSERYEQIFVEEKSPNSLVTIGPAE